MAFDLGFDFRGTLGYATDPPTCCGVYINNNIYPITFTNGNGLSINAGWVGSGMSTGNESASVDARLAGFNYHSNDGSGPYFRVDLDSGSAPGVGDYAVDIAMGDAGGGQKVEFKLLDTATLLIDGTNSGAGYSTTTAHFLDATLAIVAATTTWTGTTSVQSFATNLVKLQIATDTLAGTYSTLVHFRLTKQEAGGPEAPTRRLIVRGA